ncbi:unnamed protein product [Phytomonas sp. EM1]|nr:unnamed protein product [Phytomonas sp. EM1]|eukprot:CCW62136.1 unnamed protein product [Phytomonas sp. isolate EM1]
MCSAAAVYVGNPAAVFLSGGLLADGRCNAKLWVLNPRTGTCQGLAFPIGARFSHSMTPLSLAVGERILILGGCGSSPRAELPAAALWDPHTMRITPLSLPPESPTWARHACVALGKGRLAIVGGGFTCFSFGTFTAKPALLEIGTEVDPLPTPTTVFSGVESASKPLSTGRIANETGAYPPKEAWLTSLLALPRSVVEEVEGSAGVEKVLQAMRECRRPIVLRGASFGPCVARWADPNYLKAATKDAVVSVHVAKGAYVLDFVRKNFTFRHVPFSDLIQHLQDATAHYRAHGNVPDECWYFRSIATHMKTERANLWVDFKALGRDFCLPDGIREQVMPKMHQSCLRLNAAPLQLWTHYDTMENVLVQVVGRKRVVLFPPNQYGNLYISGSSSPVLNIDAPNLSQYPRFIDACKNAMEVILGPGDLLYFPANWYHHITTLVEESSDAPPYSLSVNVFYRRFDSSDYDKKDLYGNKDLPAVVELRRKITTHVRELIDNQHLKAGGEPLCPEYKEFALRQALQDLEGLADSLGASANQ